METKRQTIGEFIHAFLRRHCRERGPVCEFDFTDEECRRLGIYFVTALGEWSTGGEWPSFHEVAGREAKSLPAEVRGAVVLVVHFQKECEVLGRRFASIVGG
jgi:hypothetical protein